MQYFTLWMLDFFNTIRVSNSLDPGQAIKLGSDLGRTVCKGYQQMTKVAPSRQGVKYKQLGDTTFWLKPRLKLIQFGSNFFHLARVF